MKQLPNQPFGQHTLQTYCGQITTLRNRCSASTLTKKSKPRRAHSTSLMNLLTGWCLNLVSTKIQKPSILVAATGLYTQRLKTRGVGTVLGLDFSQNSLEYATQQAASSNLAIEYHLGNYLEFSDTRQFDLITLVMCDLCALNPTQRATLFAKFKTLLAENGAIALDVYTQTRFNKQAEALTLNQNAMNGFWSAEDYWCIQSSFKYDTDLVTLDKYVITEAQREWTVYNWLQHFTLDMLKAELAPHGLEVQATYSDLRGKPFADGDEMAVVIRHK